MAPGLLRVGAAAPMLSRLSTGVPAAISVCMWPICSGSVPECGRGTRC